MEFNSPDFMVLTESFATRAKAPLVESQEAEDA
jgi:hypothetical protein